ncbi:WecB/TagA/CpsF family glycosyltransferase [Candidatus Peregrinibacteria bacterium]|jgi:N-acetylglucosaminyldiphosphoundecaprenol N-acetyl-beta-D-mannosaminyltransferase|nr:WecB/TagA/CpsF family glycosyltransferase [Candidatus Peregrinibacteria bacterium]
MRKFTYILGTRINAVTFDETIKLAVSILEDKTMSEPQKKHYFTTPNPEILLKANKDNSYKEILNGSSLNIPDGTGLIFASYFLKLIGKSNTALRHRVTGSDLTIELIKKSKEHGYGIFLLGASKESNKLTTEFALKTGAKVVGNYTGKPNDPLCAELIKKSKADLVLIAFGAPAQEFCAVRYLEECPDLKLAIGIGGSFDFIAGTRQRAPHLFQKLGIEWLYRLIQEPRRIKRIINAVIIFPALVLIKSFSSSK